MLSRLSSRFEEEDLMHLMLCLIGAFHFRFVSMNCINVILSVIMRNRIEEQKR